MQEHLAQLKQQANRLPATPGVYMMKNKADEIIYIGKAKALKSRVTQYFGSGNQHTEKVRQMVAHVDHFETVLCDSEFEALVLESSLIKQYQPKYNILLKDDKGYHYIRISDEKWRRISTEMQTDKPGEYIGPYYSSYVVRETVDQVRRIFRLPDCTRSFDTPTKPCLNYHIGLCNAPCRGKMTVAEYDESVESARSFIKNGSSPEWVAELTAQMQAAADALQFETAARLRDRIAALKKLQERQKMVMAPYPAEDVFAAVSIGELFCIGVLTFRNSALSDKQHYFAEGAADRAALYAQFLPQYYDAHEIPPRIVTDISFEDIPLLEKMLGARTGKAVHFIVPQKGEQHDLVNLCRQNAAENLSAKTERSGREMSALNELADLLHLAKTPRYIESYDISHTAGSENVAGMIVFRDGRPYKPAYRRFKINGFSGQDDPRSMAEVLNRRLLEYEQQNDEAFSVLPDLILLDGGAAQIAAVQAVLSAHKLTVPLFGMVKDGKHRTRAVTAGQGDLVLRANRRAFTLVTQIQDEVHRFAIGYHRKKRSGKMLESELSAIEGIGPKRTKALLRHFKTIRAVRQATPEQLAAVPGFGKAAAEKIYRFYHPDN